MSRRVFLHVGAPKTGTTYLQDLLARNRDLIRGAGLSYPATPKGTHFEAAIDLLDLSWGGQLASARGSWAALVEQTRRAPGDVLISHEVLAAAKPDQIARAMADLAPGNDVEIQLILTARDLGRQIPAEWQETVKHRGRKRYARFVRDLREAEQTDSELWFWRVQSLPDVLTRWGKELPPERVHVVTVPQSGHDPMLLWRRFATVLGLDPGLTLQQAERANESMGVAETALIRRLNRRLKGRSIPQPVYAAVVRDLIVHQTLAGLDLSSRAGVPPAIRPFVDEVATGWQRWLADSGVDVVGDPADLLPVWPADEEQWSDPDDPDPDAVVDAAVAALTRLVERETERYREEHQGGPISRLRRVWRG